MSFDTWWNGKYATGNWLGVRDTLVEHGLTITGEVKEVYFGQISGGLPNQSRSNWLNEEKLKFIFDFQPLFGIKGLTIESNWRYRGGGNPQWAAGTPSNFSPTTYTSGTGLRIMSQQVEYSTPNKAIVINAGWENPYDQFLQQPLSKFFENNSITSSKGIGGTPGPGVAVVNNASAFNASGVPTKGSVGFYKTSPVPWSSSFASWGATLKIKPTRVFIFRAVSIWRFPEPAESLPRNTARPAFIPTPRSRRAIWGNSRNPDRLLESLEGMAGLSPVPRKTSGGCPATRTTMDSTLPARRDSVPTREKSACVRLLRPTRNMSTRQDKKYPPRRIMRRALLTRGAVETTIKTGFST